VWLDAERFTVGGTVFQTPPPGWVLPPAPLGEDVFFVAKPRELVDRYAAVVAELRPERIVELGLLAGGSTALLCELADPVAVVAVDNQRVHSPLRAFVERRGLGDVVHLHDDVDQADRPRLAGIVEAACGTQPLDLVIDDCSHLYEQTRASFNELFPRLRPGGQYIIEDWPWAHAPNTGQPDGLHPGEEPLTRLVFEIVAALGSVSGLASQIVIDQDWVRIERGPAVLDPDTFDVSAISPPRARRLLRRRRSLLRRSG
jgi:hypothetical protein